MTGATRAMAVAAACCAAIMPVLLGVPARTATDDVVVARTPLAAPPPASYGELPPESAPGAGESESYQGAEPITFGDDPTGRGRAAGLTGNGIPTVAMLAYRSAADTMARTTPQCGIDWALLAAIGRIESDHGRHGGASLGADGVAVPSILGPTLTRIRDTDGGRLDGDGTFDRAVGPMQFIPGTWQSFGADGDGDGRADPQDIDDAALAAARYLCSGGSDLIADPEQAVYRYNHSLTYVAQVLMLAEAYRSGLAGSLPEPRRIGSTAPSGDGPTGSPTPSSSPNDPDPTPSETSSRPDPTDSTPSDSPSDPSDSPGDTPRPTDSTKSPSPTVTASSPRPTATKTPTPTPSTTPCPSGSATPTPTPSPSASPTCADDKTGEATGSAQGRALSAAMLAADDGDASPSPTPSDSPTPCGSPRPTGSPTGSPTPTPTTTCEPTPCATSTGSEPPPTPCTSPDPTPSDDPTPTTSPTPTDTPKPTPTPSQTDGDEGGAGDGSGSGSGDGSSTADNPDLQQSNVGGLVTGSALESTTTPEPVVAPLPSEARLHATIIALTRDPCVYGVGTAAPPWNGDRPRPVPVPAAVPVTGLPTHYPGIDSAVLGTVVAAASEAHPAAAVDVRSQARSPPARSPPERGPPA